MKRRFRSLAAVLAVAGTCVFAEAQGSSQPKRVDAEQTAQATGPRIELSTRAWDFGEVWQGEPRPQVKITVKNVGDAPLVLSVDSTCGCTFPSKPKSPLAPGESDVMTITYDSIKRTGPTRQTVTLTTNEPQRPKAAILVTGTVKPVYDLKPISEVSFGKIFEGSRETRVLEITNKFTEKLAVELPSGQDFKIFDVKVREVEPGMRYELIATTRPPMPIGLTHVQARLRMGLERLPEIQVSIYGSVEPPIAIDRKQLFWSRSSPMTLEQPLIVSYAPDRPVKIVEVRSTVEAVKVKPGEVLPAKTPPGALQQELMVLLPPGDQIPDGVEPSIEILTDSDDPQYKKLVVPIKIIGQRASPPG